MKRVNKRRLFSIGLVSLILLSYAGRVYAQEEFFQGYKNEVSGAKFTYHSPLNSTESSLIVRAHKSFKPIVWQTEIVPADYNEKTVSFIWLYGIDVLVNTQQFEVFINGNKWFEFSSPANNDKDSWSVSGKEGAELKFNKTMIDKHKDQMGYVVLKLPTSAITKGEAVTISIKGVANESSAWFMTFKTELKRNVEISQVKTVVREDNKLYHSAQFDFIHLGNPVNAKITIDDLKKEVTLNEGHNAFVLNLPKVEKETTYTAEIKIGKQKAEAYTFVLKPVKEWTIHLVQHTHTDIGYTRPQTEILAEHLRFIDYALDYCDKTDHYPENAKFRWTCEASWTVREYLKSRPESQINRLLQRIKEGRIEVTGMFFNFSEIVDETALAIQAKTIKDFKDRGIDVKTAMQNDVNGIGWCMIDLYQNTGVKYLTMGQHGHRAHVPFDKPTSFWWQSPAGNRLLAYRSEHYMHGNALSLTTGYMDMFRDNLSVYLDKLEAKQYPYDRTAIQFSGYETDNSPPSTIACDIVKEWNEKYEWPKLKLSLASEFMVYLDKHESNSLPVKEVAWPDWWTDGFGSAANETKASRNTHADMIANLGLLSMTKMMDVSIPDELITDVSRCYDNLLFYDEHTFGAAESITDPLSENSIIQWGEKSAYAWTAVKEASLIREKTMGLIQPYLEKTDVPSIFVFNTLAWKRSGVVETYIDHEILPLDKEFSIRDDAGNEVPVQLMRSRSDGSYWSVWVSDIPPVGFKRLQIYVKEEPSKHIDKKLNQYILENDYYKIKVDPTSGTIAGLYDKALQKDLVDKNSSIKLGEFVYEQLEDRRAMERLTNQNRDTVYVPLEKNISGLSDVKISEVTEGSLWSSIKINGKVPVCADKRGINIEIRLHHNKKLVELLYSMHKLPVTNPEAVYVGFPFHLSGSDKLAFEAQGGIVYPGINQLEGTASDWNTIQNFAAVRNNDGQIIFSSNDIPLVQFGNINSGRFYYTYKPEKSHIFSWVLNNYWTTNFRAKQEGEIKWAYQITSTGDNSSSKATRFGWNNRIPLLSRVVTATGSKSALNSKSLIELDLPNLLIVNMKPSIEGDGIIIHLREVEGDHAILDINKIKQETNVNEIVEVNVLEEEMQELTAPMLIEHFETRFIKLKY